MDHATAVKTDLLVGRADFAATLVKVFGRASDPIELVEQRAAELLPGFQVIVWEGDPQTFQFSYVSDSAERVLGYGCARWVSEPDFWVETVVHPDDRSDAVAFCAVATGQGRDHDFLYRAVNADGQTVVLHDIVQVAKSPKGVPSRLRGIMIAVSRDV